MACQQVPLNDGCQTIAPCFRSQCVSTVRRTTSLLRTKVAERHDRPWLALVVLPLLMTGTAFTPLTQRYLLWLPMVCLTWWWCSVEWRWAWLVGVLEAVWGLQWAYVGIYWAFRTSHAIGSSLASSGQPTLLSWPQPEPSIAGTTTESMDGSSCKRNAQPKHCQAMVLGVY